MDNDMFWAIGYTIIALVLMVFGFVQESAYFIGAIVVGACACYWIWKSSRRQ
ncbi:hypothetical protein GOV13_02855 [Candidatus Pacearchaeota archaeon]|nr:hypothetical protein [Candidatus Pacearchaeota archaeon]